MERLSIQMGQCVHAVPAKLGSVMKLLALSPGVIALATGHDPCAIVALRDGIFEICEVYCDMHALGRRLTDDLSEWSA